MTAVKWILVIFMSNGPQGVAIDHIPMLSEEACREAAHHLTTNGGRPAISSTCIRNFVR